MPEFTRFRRAGLCLQQRTPAAVKVFQDLSLLGAQENVAEEEKHTQDPNQRTDLAMFAGKEFQEGE